MSVCLFCCVTQAASRQLTDFRLTESTETELVQKMSNLLIPYIVKLRIIKLRSLQLKLIYGVGIKLQLCLSFVARWTIRKAQIR